MNVRTLWLGLLTLSVALAPAPQDPAPAVAPQTPPPAVSTSASLRIQAGVKAYDMAWLYYSENRIQADTVYRWSKRLLEAERDASPEKANQVAACEAHLERIKKLEAKIRKIRRIGFGDSLDVVEADYYRKEADFWFDQAKSSK
jgi:hypothetical protein